MCAKPKPSSIFSQAALGTELVESTIVSEPEDRGTCTGPLASCTPRPMGDKGVWFGNIVRAV